MARRPVDVVKLKKTEEHGYEFVVGRFDYHACFEDGVWRLDQFDASIKDAEAAHVRTVECESLAECIHHALEEPQL